MALIFVQTYSVQTYAQKLRKYPVILCLKCKLVNINYLLTELLYTLKKIQLSKSSTSNVKKVAWTNQ